MSKAVVLEQHEILCASGTLRSASKAIIDGTTAVREGPCFDYDVSYAPFPDQTWATLTGAAEAFGNSPAHNRTRLPHATCPPPGAYTRRNEYRDTRYRGAGLWPGPGLQADDRVIPTP